MNWTLWFLQLSGWPVFLVIVAAVLVFMLAMSVVLTWLGSRSVIQAALLAVLGLTVLSLGFFGILVLLNRLLSH
jgi:uncharacterized membrane protein